MTEEARPKKDRRSEAVRVRLRKPEHDGLTKLSTSLGHSSSEIVRRLVREAITGGPDFFADGLQELREAHRQLASVGRNLNQLAKVANRDDTIVAAELRGELAAVKTCVEDLARIYRKAVEQAQQRTVKSLNRKG